MAFARLYVGIVAVFYFDFWWYYGLITGVIIETDIIGSDLLKNSDPETQSNMPDVPYEPHLDIEIDFPRGSKNAVLFFRCEVWFCTLVMVS